MNADNAVVQANDGGEARHGHIVDQRLGSGSLPATSRVVHSGLLAGALAAPMFIACDVIDAATRPGYSVVRHWVSHRALGELGWIGTISILACAILLCLDAAALLAVRKRAQIRSAHPVAVAVAAVGLLLAGLFPIDPSLGFPPGAASATEPTISGRVHDLAGPGFIIGLAIAAFLTGRLFRRLQVAVGWTGLGWVTGTAILTAFVMTSLLVTLDYAGLVPAAPSGLFERLAIYPALIWNSLVSLHLLRARHLGRHG